jgi:glucose/arabinose dehydrogenase
VPAPAADHGSARLAATLLALLTWLALPHPLALAQAPDVVLEPWLDGLTLPVSLTPVGDAAGHVLVAELEGRVRWAAAGALRAEPFLDLGHRVTGLVGEQGLFSVALEPAARAAARGRPRHAVAAFTEIGSGDLVVAAYPVDDERAVADPNGEVVILRVPMPEPFHHGGQVRFGTDGLLYVSVGEGQRDPAWWTSPPWSAQSLASLRGKVLRLDLLPTSGAAYAVPADNPFVGAADLAEGPLRPEVWARGFRNPWKFTFEPGSAALLVADVGEDRWESVHRAVAGSNHGWPVREGPECLLRADGAGQVDPACDPRDVAPPWLSYAHPSLDPDGGLAVVGGSVVRDPALPTLAGRYLFGDFVLGRLWVADAGGGGRTLLLATGLPLTAIEEGPRGEVLVVSIDGRVQRLVAP